MGKEQRRGRHRGERTRAFEAVAALISRFLVSLLDFLGGPLVGLKGAEGWCDGGVQRVTSEPPLKWCQQIISRATVINAGPRNVNVPRSRITMYPTKPESGVWRILLTRPCYPPTSQMWLKSKERCLEKSWEGGGWFVRVKRKLALVAR